MDRQYDIKEISRVLLIIIFSYTHLYMSRCTKLLNNCFLSVTSQISPIVHTCPI